MEFGQRPDPGRRLAGIGFVVVFHAALIYALVTGLARKAIEKLPAPIETKILQEIKPQVEPPPPPPPTFQPPPPTFVPPPEIVIAQPPPRPAAITATATERPPPVAAAPQGPTRVAPVINAKRGCREPEYPSASARLGEKGTVMLAFLIGVDGKVTESRVQTSSGFPRLDEAARAAIGRCKFVPGTLNGVPEPAWANIKYTWKIPG